LVTAGASGLHADPLDRFLEPWTMSSPYAGVGLTQTHHTGYALGVTSSTEEWTIGGKVYAGFRFSEAFSGEIAYHRLGEVEADGVFNRRSVVDSQALAASLLLKFPLSDIPWIGPVLLADTSFHLKGGAAVKWIRQTFPGAAPIRHRGPTYLIGFGVERNFGERAFARFEYEYIGKIGAGPTIDVQHTPISVSVGMRF
jgi:opacity protein-like surface antigen